jgi:hypothetical protein
MEAGDREHGGAFEHPGGDGADLLLGDLLGEVDDYGLLGYGPLEVDDAPAPEERVGLVDGGREAVRVEEVRRGADEAERSVRRVPAFGQEHQRSMTDSPVGGHPALLRGELVEAAGIEPASRSTTQSGLHA